MTTTDPIALSERDDAKTNDQQGLYRKFDVRRTDGTDCPGGKPDGCEHFVLDMTHDKHARAALTAYADSVAASFPELAADLRSRYALTPAPQVPGDMALCNAILRHQFQDEHRGGRLTVDVETLLHDYNAHKAAPPLNELLGHREEFNLNEVSGNSGQLASLEQRALALSRLANGEHADWKLVAELAGQHGIRYRNNTGMVAFLGAITAALSAQPQSEVVSEPGAIRALVTAANAVLALYPADDGMWTLEQAVRPFNAAKPGECENGCPDNQVCDYCQFAAPQPREVRGVEYDRELIAEMLDDLLSAEAAAEDRGTTEGRSYFNRDAIAAQAKLLRAADNREGQARTVRLGPATTPQDAAGVEPVAWMATSKPSSDGTVAIQFTHNIDYANQCRRADWTVTPLYTTPPPGVDVGKLRELVQGWRDEANAGYLTGKPEIDSITEARQHVYFECADKLDATMAEPGVKK